MRFLKVQDTRLLSVVCVVIIVSVSSTEGSKSQMTMINNCNRIIDNSESVGLKKLCLNIFGNIAIADNRKSRPNGTSEQQPVEQTRRRRSINECPHMTDEYLAESRSPGLRSLSPYDTVVDCQSNRNPKCITQHVCLCNYCIDPVTRKEGFNFYSAPITISIDVTYHRKGGKIETVKESVVTGCTCVFPRIYKRVNS